jgi:D-alanyl-D-alanine dipeptidase
MPLKLTTAVPRRIAPPLVGSASASASRWCALLALGITLALNDAAAVAQADQVLPLGFVDLALVAPDIALDVRYAGGQNFVGRPVHGYNSPRCLLSRAAARALAQVEADLAPQGLALLVYDCYRPQRAVDDFVTWAHDPLDETTRSRHYPAVPKAELFRRGYIAGRSGHSRGSTVDLTLIARAGTRPLAAASEPDDCRLGAADGSVDMGTTFDCFDERAHTDHPGIAPAVQSHRRLLRRAMVRRGFAPYAKEWWHFTLAGEPFPDRYFDFEIR